MFSIANGFSCCSQIIYLICLCHVLEKNSAPVILWFNIIFRFIRLLPALFRLFSRDLFTEEWPETPGTACRDHPPNGKKDRKAQPWEKCVGTQQPHNSEYTVFFWGQVSHLKPTFPWCLPELGTVRLAWLMSAWLILTQALERECYLPFMEKRQLRENVSLPRVLELGAAEMWTRVCVQTLTLVKTVLSRELRAGNAE